ncbi:hypothetical protein IV203_021501 [Nitzschia inconspicua]|uniref:Uncharacterized protein n=1 Tax=Nitzschia inconspicua TaxID=303405 RepID=A0A9K3K8U7_9STRA|nr:hypothetical protein IV203_022699 [Nitzschia inconspicua]KAG7343556.1 hypothetical protein IV203_021501 [Nitzschia inconspicua]
MTSISPGPPSSNNKKRDNGTWKDVFIQVCERVAERSCVSACMPLQSDGTHSNESLNEYDRDDDDIVMNPPSTIFTADASYEQPQYQQKQQQSVVDISFEEEEEEEITRIDQLYGMAMDKEGDNTTFVPRPVTHVSTRRVSSASSSAVSSRSSVSFMNPFPLFPRPNSPFTTTREARSFDSLARSSDTFLLQNSSFERELPSFGTHRTHGDESSGMSSYSQTYSPALSSYLDRSRERSFQKNLPDKQHRHVSFSLDESPLVSQEKSHQAPSFSMLLLQNRSVSSSTSTSTEPTGNPRYYYDPFVYWQTNSTSHRE